MYETISRLIYCFPYILLIIFHICHGAIKDEQYLDSISCTIPKNRISLLPNKTLVIKLSRWADYHRGLSFLNFQCKFQVIAPRGYGIIATIQSLHLRTKNPEMMMFPCRDYVKFEQRDGLEGGPICGEITEGDKISEKPIGLIGPRSFYDPKGILDVGFKFDDSQREDVQKPFRLEIAFTATSECTSTGLLTRQILQCAKSRPYSCISSNLLCDGVTNCGFRGDFGSDETKCSDDTTSRSTSLISNPGGLFNMNEGGLHKIDFTFGLARATNIREPISTNYYPGILSTSSTNHNHQNHPSSTVSNSNKEKNSLSSKSTIQSEHRWSDVHLGVPIQIFALVSAISGALIVLFIFFLCCCLMRHCSQRNLASAQNLSSRRAEGNAHEINEVPHSAAGFGHERRTAEIIPMNSIVVKNPEDLPPSYEAIFPEVVSQKH